MTTNVHRLPFIISIGIQRRRRDTMTFYDSSCKPAFAALFFRRGSDDSPPHPPGADLPRARGRIDLTNNDN